MLTASEIKRQVRSGLIFRDGVLLASFLGHPGARDAAPEVAPAPAGLEALVARLAELPLTSRSFRHIALVRAMLALVRPLVAGRPDRATGFHATETWAICPCEMCLTALRTLCVHGLAADEPAERQLQYQVAGVAMDAAFAGEVMRAAAPLVDRAAMRRRVADELLGWALRERDPVRASIGTRVFFRLDPAAAEPGIRRLARDRLDPVIDRRLAALARSPAEPGFASPPALPVTAGERRDLLANDHGLLVASDRMKEALVARVGGLQLAPATVGGERAWLASIRAPRPALVRAGDPVLLDPDLVAGAPVLFRVEEPDRTSYLIDRAYIGDLLQAGIRTGIDAHGAPFGRSRGRPS